MFQASGALPVLFLIPSHPWPDWQFLKGFQKRCLCPCHCHIESCCPIHRPESRGTWPIHHPAPQRLFGIPVTLFSFLELDQLRGVSSITLLLLLLLSLLSFGQWAGEDVANGGERERNEFTHSLFFSSSWSSDSSSAILDCSSCNSWEPWFEWKLFPPKLHSWPLRLYMITTVYIAK